MRFLTLLTASLLLLSGCGGSDEWAAKRPKVYEAGGTVMMDGSPLEGAVVVYHSSQYNISAQGTTDANGKFTLTTFKDNDGAAEGAHKVVITKRIYEDVKTKYDSEHESSVAKIPKDLLPKKYAAPTTTDIEVTVSAKDTNDATIEISSK